jgi:hypothetical protein
MLDERVWWLALLGGKFRLILNVLFPNQHQQFRHFHIHNIFKGRNYGRIHAGHCSKSQIQRISNIGCVEDGYDFRELPECFAKKFG